MDWKQIFRRRESVASAASGQWTIGSATCESGARKYRLWVPGSYDPRVPSALVMMLHGCHQKPEELAEISGMNAVAVSNNFLVVYPEQTLKANLLRCWNWFERKHQGRGAGEPAILAQVVHQVRLWHNVDPHRVYVAGISAGAAMAIILGATYPDVFAGVGTVAGLEFRAADGVMSGLRAMKHGGPDPRHQGAAAFQAMNASLSSRPTSRVPIIVFHGNADSNVNPVNADQIITQWAVANQLLNGSRGGEPDTVGERTDGTVSDGYSYQRYAYKDADGRLLMEKWMVDSLRHAWPGSPLPGPYADPKGPNAAQEMWRFFSETSAVPAAAVVRPQSLLERSADLLRGAGKYLSELFRGQK